MIRILTCLTLIICLGCPVFAQRRNTRSPQVEQTQKMLEDAAKKGKEVPVKNLSVGSNVRTEAVLIPRVDVDRIFGKEIADHYAVIQLIVGNKSSDAALIIHGIFIDYTRWPLSGTTPSTSVHGLVREQDAPFQAENVPNQIASEEYRVVRGQLLDAQMWSKRNWTVRVLTFLGNLAGAYSFSLKEKGLLKGIAAFNGVIVPGAAELWPDGTVAQLNRVSDFGYQANKVIPQQGSDIIVCFFPIDRFLTPGFRKLFLRSPALFFAPLQMLGDKTIQGDVRAALVEAFGSTVKPEDMALDMPCFLNIMEYQDMGGFHQGTTVDAIAQAKVDACLPRFGLKWTDGKLDVLKPLTGKDDNDNPFSKFLRLDFIRQMSLNTVTVVVDGVMTVDTGAIAAKIDSIEFDKLTNCGTDETQCFWRSLDTGSGVRTGTIHGSYLTSGSVKIIGADEAITDIKTIGEGSSDQALKFSFKLTKALDPQSMLHFVVSKPIPGATEAKSAKTKDSVPYDYLVHYFTTGPTVTKVELDENQNTATITGSNFAGSDKSPLVITLTSPDDEDIVVKPKEPITTTKLIVDIPADKKTPGCWTVRVTVGVPRNEVEEEHTFLITPSPKLDSATLDGDTIVVKGKDLIDTSDCGGKKLTFQLLKEGAKQPIALKPPDSPTSSNWVFEVPSDAKHINRDPYKVKLLLGNKEAASVDLAQPDKKEKPKKSQ